MATSPASTVVGTYPTEGEAQRARERLTEAGIEPVEIEQLQDTVWQVHAPATDRPRALEIIRDLEKHTISDAW